VFVSFRWNMTLASWYKMRYDRSVIEQRGCGGFGGRAFEPLPEV